MRVLAFEAAHTGCSAALLDGHEVLVERRAEGRGRVVEDLVPLTMAVLADAGLTAKNLDAVAVLVGPGGFTGVRAGVAAARAWALGAGLPIWGIDALQVAAVEALLAGQTSPVLVEAELGRGECASRLFDADGFADSVDDRPGTAIGLKLGQGPDAAALARAVAWFARRGCVPIPGETVLPFYGRDADARLAAGRSLIGGP